MKKLVLTNFKCHKNLEIEFSNINMFVGDNNSGKSSGSYTPLDILINNKPFLPSFISQGETYSSIKLLIDDDNWVIRTQTSKNKQSTEICIDGEVSSYTGVKGLEDLIHRSLNINLVELEPNKLVNINFMPIRAELMLINKSPEKVRRILLSVLGYQNLELLCNDYKKDLQDTQSKISSLQTTQDSLQHDLKMYSAREKFLKKLKDRVDSIEKKKSLLNYKVLPTYTKFNNLYSKLDNIKELFDIYNSIPENIEKPQEFDTKLIDKLLQSLSTFNSISQLLFDQVDITSKINETNKSIAKLPKVCDTCGKPI